MVNWILKVEGLLRLLSVSLLILAAFLVGLDTQTKIFFFTVEKKATFKAVDAFLALVIVDTVAAGFNLLQLSKCFILARSEGNPTEKYIYLAWVLLLFDQVMAYVTFATNSAAAQASAFAITGVSSFEWTKVCNMFTRFCLQIGGALICNCIATFLLIVLSSISAFNLFSLYSSQKILVLKGK